LSWGLPAAAPPNHATAHRLPQRALLRRTESQSIIRMFLDVEIEVCKDDASQWTIAIGHSAKGRNVNES
jgi:hypothetical protein